MVEAPRIRILYERLRYVKNRIIASAVGPSYVKANVDVVGYVLRKWWFAGKYMYAVLVKGGSKLVIRTHMMMYGRIVVDGEKLVNPKLRAFMTLTLDDGTVIAWYMTQIRILDPANNTDIIASNYRTGTAKQLIADSLKMRRYDVSSENYDREAHIQHVWQGIVDRPEIILTDLLLDQLYFPGVGNIIQQEALYRCCLLPSHQAIDLNDDGLICLIDKVKEVVVQLYTSHTDREAGLEHKRILQIYHKSYCPCNHKTVTKYLGYHDRRTTWCPVCQL